MALHRNSVNQGQVTKDEPPTAQPHTLQAPTITLPKGGGAIRGIGEKFAANPVTGAGALTIPIATTPGRGGFGPQLTLTYDSGAGNGPFGLGWHLTLPAITRKTDKGLPRYQDGEESDDFILAGAEDLVPVLLPNGERFADNETAPGFVIHHYRPRVEGLFARIERWTDQGTGVIHWRSISKENITTLYGLTNNARIFDPADPQPAQPTRIFSWLISQSYDDKGNALLYEYVAENGDKVDRGQANERNRQRTANRYLKRVRYGNRTPNRTPTGQAIDPATLPNDAWLFEVVLDYGEHNVAAPSPVEPGSWSPRPDPFSSYRTGFEVRTYRRCERFLLFHHIPDDPDRPEQRGYDGLVRATELHYETVDAPTTTTATPIYSKLVRVTQKGYERQPDGAYQSRALPPVDFTYSAATIDPMVRTMAADDLENLPIGLDGVAYQWVDLDGEGMTGILSEQAGAWFYQRNRSPLNRVGANGDAHLAPAFGPLELVATKPNLALAAGAQWLDLAGDGRPDLVQFSGATPGFYERTMTEGWAPFTPFAVLPRVEWRDPNLKFIDLNGDGHADLLFSEEDAFVWYGSLGEAGFGAAQRCAQSKDEESGPRLVFADGEEAIYLADLSGDGLTDLVRIRNGAICYWPNLGYGRFGAKVTMDNAPWFDRPDHFDQRRIRLADIDGSGTTDIIYLHGDGVRLYFNQSGNCWSAAVTIPFPALDNLATVQVVDLLGNGTACLVWSSPLPGHARQPLAYINLMGEQKPHLLITTKNNLGATTQIDYAPSTKFYLQDKRDGKPWITKLPFPVHCVAKVTITDQWRQTRFTTTYSYHHGYFDGAEREFRGFGRVEQVDVEEYGAFAAANGNSPYITADQTLYQPPVKRVTWYHTGAFLDRERILQHFAHEYFPQAFPAKSLAGDFQENHLPEPDLATLALSTEEWRQALRACKGMLLRQEIYELDVAALARGEVQPVKLFSAANHNCHIQRLQPQGHNRHAIFLVTESEAISYHYELDLRPATLTPDPRIAHTLNLRIDEYGNQQQTVSVVYPRLGHHSDETLPAATVALIRQVQDEMHLAYKETRYTNDAIGADHYRLRLPCEVLTYELTGIKRTDADDEATVDDPLDDRYFTLDELRAYHLSPVYQRDEIDKIAVAEIAYHRLPDPGVPQKRLVEQTQTIFFQETLAGAEPLGTLNRLALPYESYQLALTPDLLSLILAEKLTPAVGAALADKSMSGYQRDATGQYWLCSGVAGFAADASQHFYLPEQYTDPFGNRTTLTYDRYDLYVQASVDAVGNRTEVTLFDFRVLAPCRLQEPNANLSEVRFDLVGMPTALALLGKGEEGDNLNAFDVAARNPSPATLIDFFVTRDYTMAQAQTFLGNATARHLYYFGEVIQEDQIIWGQHPPCAAAILREQHVAQNPASPVQSAFEYADGMGNVLVKKVPAEAEASDGPLRWVASGKTILNNKGKPVKQYEPYFSPPAIGHRFAEPVAMGVTPILYYDAVGRLIRTEAPDGSYSRVDFSPWQVTSYDGNDTSQEAGNGWFARMNGSAKAEERRAAQLAAQHADTPAATLLDSLGRAVITIAHNKVNDADEKLVTYTKLDAEGKPLWVQDARGNRVMAYIQPLAAGDYAPCYDLAGNLLGQQSMDAGNRWLLNDAAGKPLFAWNSRGFTSRFAYDALRRLTAAFVTATGENERQVEKLLYGEDQPDDVQHNLRGKLYQHFDTAGLVTMADYDFKGNPLTQRRTLLVDYKSTPDWSQEMLLEAESFTTQTAFDAMNRPRTITTPDQSVYRPTFNAANLLDKVAVNLRGARENDQPQWTPFVNNIAYNAKGQRTRIDYANGATTTYDYDEQTFRLRNLKSTRTNQPDATASALFQAATVVQDLHYTYDPVGNITRIADTAHKTIFHDGQPIAAVNDYRYDALYRLVAASGRERKNAPQYDWQDHGNTLMMPPNTADALGCYVETYGYDGVGNVLQMVHHAGSVVDQPGVVTWQRRYDYAADNNRLRATSLPGDGEGVYSARYSYDAHGNMMTMPHLPLLQWDFKDQLRATAQQVVNDGGTPVTTWYVYDAAGQRVRKVTENQNGVRSQERLYLGGYEIYREYTGGVVALERETLHVMDDQQRIALVETKMVENQAPIANRQPLIRYQLGNHLGSAALELDKDGFVISYEEYTPYGSTAYCAGRNTAEVSLKRYRYTGKERDAENGFTYHGARYYAPWLGRWVSADPAGMVDGNNLFAFVRNNPIRLTDTDGKQSKENTPILHLSLTPEQEDIIRENEKVFKPIEQNLERQANSGKFSKPVAKTPASASTTTDPATQTEWVFPTNKHSPIPMVKSLDTGNRPLNFTLNKIVLPWRNLLAAVENTPFEMMGEFDDAMRRSPFAMEWQAFQDMAPLAPAMGMTTKIPGEFNYLRFTLSGTGTTSTTTASQEISPALRAFTQSFYESDGLLLNEQAKAIRNHIRATHGGNPRLMVGVSTTFVEGEQLNLVNVSDPKIWDILNAEKKTWTTGFQLGKRPVLGLDGKLLASEHVEIAGPRQLVNDYGAKGVITGTAGPACAGLCRPRWLAGDFPYVWHTNVPWTPQ